MESILITGFGPFLNVGENPSQWLAERSALPFRILEVSFQGVEEFLASGETEGFDTLLHLGVAGGAERMRFETTARNVIGPTHDVLGEVQGPGKIDAFGPPQIGATLWDVPSAFVDTEVSQPSVDAGGYLCNYLLYRSLQVHPGKRVGFLHVPPVEKMDLERQLGVLWDVLGLIEG
ncbi:MAG: hypothetical protein KF784_02790 [Fimbriimonadaceae bacterium]|nr:hypothetical protein [Fimbriimonadaceae bacterium]